MNDCLEPAASDHDERLAISGTRDRSFLAWGFPWHELARAVRSNIAPNARSRRANLDYSVAGIVGSPWRDFGLSIGVLDTADRHRRGYYCCLHVGVWIHRVPVSPPIGCLRVRRST